MHCGDQAASPPQQQLRVKLQLKKSLLHKGQIWHRFSRVWGMLIYSTSQTRSKQELGSFQKNADLQLSSKSTKTASQPCRELWRYSALTGTFGTQDTAVLQLRCPTSDITHLRWSIALNLDTQKLLSQMPPTPKPPQTSNAEWTKSKDLERG